MKKLFTLFLLTLLPLLASADPVEIDGIYYNLNSRGNVNTAEVTSGLSKYSGDIVIPESVTFEETVYSVTSISWYAFSGCSGLTSISIPNSVTSIGGGAFSGCSGLNTIKVESENMTYDSRDNCNAIIETSSNTLITGCKNTIIPNSVTSIGGSAFSGCSGLNSITIPNSVTSIGHHTFYNCTGLTSITIPNSVTFIGQEAFDGTAWYDNQPDGVVYVGKMLYKYKGLIPESTTIDIEEGTLGIAGGAFNNCSGLTSITIPNSVTSIGDGAFNNCSGLTSIIIPNSVTSIGYSAFSYCYGLTSVTLGNSVESIDDQAFWTCTNLHDLYCYAENKPSTSWRTFAYKHYYGLESETETYYVLWHVPVEYINNYDSSYNTDVVAIDDTYTLKYLVDGEEYKSAKIYEGAPITPEPAPTKDGYDFSGWSTIPSIMPSEDVTITGTFTIIADEDEIKITTAGQTTWCSAYDLDFTDVEGLKAYSATGYDRETGVIWLTRIYRVPANEGILLIGEAGDYKIPHKSTSAYYANFLVGTLTDKTISETEGEYTNYYLSNGSYGVGFYKVNGSVDLKANRAYLPLLKNEVSNSRGFIGLGFDDDSESTTGISEAELLTGERNVWYNFQGQRVGNPGKGLFIKNGKKVIIR